MDNAKVQMIARSNQTAQNANNVNQWSTSLALTRRFVFLVGFKEYFRRFAFQNDFKQSLIYNPVSSRMPLVHSCCFYMRRQNKTMPENSDVCNQGQEHQRINNADKQNNKKPMTMECVLHIQIATREC